jgi:hypothetical protein
VSLPTVMTRSASCPVVVLLLGLTVAATAAPASAGRAAACVAALKGREASLTATLKAGAAVEPELLRVVRSGYAFVGRQYLAGLGEAEARKLLDSAEQAFEALPPDQRKLRQAQCLQEGERLYAESSVIERSLISSAAERRVQRMKSR